MTSKAVGPDLTISPGNGASSSARDDRRVRVEAEIEETALELFAARGFEAVTIDEIAEAAGISRRTFFRYFGSKEELLLRDVRRRVGGFVEALRERPRDEPVLVSLRAAAMTMVAGYQADRDAWIELMRIIAEAPAILARNLGEPMALMDAVVNIVGERLDADPVTDLRPGVIAMTIMDACNLAMRLWLLNPGADFTPIAERALDLVEPGLEAVVAAAPTGV
jgi:AcrR family transcriptional regulator